MSLVDELKTVIEGEVDDSQSTLDTYSTDASLFKVMPRVVVRPKDAQDIQALVRFVSKKRSEGEDVSLTPRAAGTDMSGGPLTESIVVDMLPYFNHTMEVISEPGGETG